MDFVVLYRRAAAEFDRFVAATADDQWANPTPCEEWDVRALVNHVASEQLWAAPLLAGKTVAEVGDRFDGDQLGDDPKAAWQAAMADAVHAVTDGELPETVHVSWGEIPTEMYLGQMFCDLVVHGWDLARGIGADARIDPELAEVCYEWSKPQEDFMKDSGLFGERLEPAADADVQTRLLYLFGRRP